MLPSFSVDLQSIYSSDKNPLEASVKEWIGATLEYINALSPLSTKEIEVTLRIVDKTEIQALNKAYRKKDKPTNVLSFRSNHSSELMNYLSEYPLGDIIACGPVIEEEAISQHKNLKHHWAHMVVHSTLHLLGYDHEKEEEANIMESYEIAILDKFAISNPYDQPPEAKA